MLEILYILLAGVIVFAVGLPVVTTYDKWKKEMKNEQTDENERT